MFSYITGFSGYMMLHLPFFVSRNAESGFSSPANLSKQDHEHGTNEDLETADNGGVNLAYMRGLIGSSHEESRK
jgi:hypothetical protein